MEKKKWIIFAVVCLVTIGFVFYLAKDQKRNQDSTEDIDTSKYDVTKYIGPNEDNGQIGDFYKGLAPEKAKLTTIEVFDSQCPGCAGLNPTIDGVMEKYKDKMTYVSRSIVIPAHTNSLAAQAAIIAGGLQNKYWEMKTAVLEKQNTWGLQNIADRTNTFYEIAKSINIPNLEQFKSDMSSSRVKKKIDFDTKIAKSDKMEVKATPSIFFNGDSLSDTKKMGSKESLETLIRENLEKVKVDIKDIKKY